MVTVIEADVIKTYHITFDLASRLLNGGKKPDGDDPVLHTNIHAFADAARRKLFASHGIAFADAPQIGREEDMLYRILPGGGGLGFHFCHIFDHVPLGPNNSPAANAITAAIFPVALTNSTYSLAYMPRSMPGISFVPMVSYISPLCGAAIEGFNAAQLKQVTGAIISKRKLSPQEAATPFFGLFGVRASTPDNVRRMNEYGISLPDDHAPELRQACGELAEISMREFDMAMMHFDAGDDRRLHQLLQEQMKKEFGSTSWDEHLAASLFLQYVNKPLSLEDALGTIHGLGEAEKYQRGFLIRQVSTGFGHKSPESFLKILQNIRQIYKNSAANNGAAKHAFEERLRHISAKVAEWMPDLDKNIVWPCLHCSP